MYIACASFRNCNQITGLIRPRRRTSKFYYTSQDTSW